MQKSAEIFWQTSPDIYSIDNIAQSSFFYTVIWLTIIMSHHYLPIQIIKFFLKLINIIGKITLFCISICIMKHLKQKTQNNWFLTQIIVALWPGRWCWLWNDDPLITESHREVKNMRAAIFVQHTPTHFLSPQRGIQKWLDFRRRRRHGVCTF